MLYEMQVAALTQDPDTSAPILFLKSVNSEHTIPIWIGMLEAVSIASALQNIKFDRPMTHDLFKNFVEQMGVDMVKIEICDLKDSTFYARIYFTSENGNFDMDARPSDAIALALRFDKRIYVDEEVVKKSLSGDTSIEVLDDTDEGKKWAEYLENLDADDFGKYKM